jgi:hypothetical protein
VPRHAAVDGSRTEVEGWGKAAETNAGKFKVTSGWKEHSVGGVGLHLSHGNVDLKRDRVGAETVEDGLVQLHVEKEVRYSRAGALVIHGLPWRGNTAAVRGDEGNAAVVDADGLSAT